MKRSDVVRLLPDGQHPRRKAEVDKKGESGAEGDPFETAPVPIQWLACDGTILRANRAALELLGYKREEYIGRNIADFHVGPNVDDILRRLSGGEALRGYHATLRCKDGSIKHVLLDSSVRRQNGAIVRAECFTRDVSEQKRTEDALKALSTTLEERVIQRSGYIRLLQEIAVAANEADVVETAFQFAVDRICAYQDWPVGHAYLFCKDFNSACAGPIWNLKDPQRYRPFKEASDAAIPPPDSSFIGRVIATQAPVALLDVAQDPGFYRAKEAARVGLKGAVAFPVLIGKEVVAALEFFCDKPLRVEEELLKVMAIIGTQLGRVVERKRNEARLRESERLAAMGKTAAVFAHEVANPLNGLSTTCQLLKRHFAKGGDSFASATIETIQTEINRLASLLHNFRSLSRPQQLNLAKLDVVQLVREVLAGAGVERTSSVLIVEDFPPDMPEIVADSEKLKQVFLNLYKNALEAMPKGGTLTLSGRNRGHRVILEFQDTGVGIEPGIDIFELFTTTKPEGTGLGLAIVRQIIAAHGGSISYRSRPGEGTRFTIALPTDPSQVPAA
ncbi:MAG TPA: ATP-binding protein [Candidatus Acidoferrales bacterium]|nr:ATP-binding protein [Candidatus Acidoferrales bacterium]